MDPLNQKIELFEYFLKRLVEWFCDEYFIQINEFNNNPNNDLSKLKVIKLHFFACSTDREAIELFDSFHAMPYGHVETDIYSSLNKLPHFEVTNSKLLIKEIDFFYENPVLANADIIDKIIKNLKEENNKLISTKPFDLVELSHRWFSWKYTFGEARRENSFSKKINPAVIEKEHKFYSTF